MLYINWYNGLRIIPKIEIPEKIPIKITPNKIFGPWTCRLYVNWGYLSENKFPKIWPPSSGYNGSKLNNARYIFIWMKICKNVLTPVFNNDWLNKKLRPIRHSRLKTLELSLHLIPRRIRRGLCKKERFQNLLCILK